MNRTGLYATDGEPPVTGANRKGAEWGTQRQASADSDKTQVVVRKWADSKTGRGGPATRLWLGMR